MPRVTQPVSDPICTSPGAPIAMQAGTNYLGSEAVVAPREHAIADLSDTARLPQSFELHIEPKGLVLASTQSLSTNIWSQHGGGRWGI